MPDLIIAVKAVNDAGPALTALHGDLAKVGSAAKDLHPHLQAAGEHTEKMGEKAHGAGGHVKELGGHVDTMKGHLSTLAPMLAGIGAAFAGAFAMKSAISSTAELGGEIQKLKRLMGGTAEAASILHFQLQETGVSFESGEKGIKKFEKALAGTADLADGIAIPTGKAMSKVLLDLGVHAEDAAGNLKPMSAILPDLAERFKEMPDGIQKTALSMNLFGKSGTDLIPFLNKGKEGLAELGAEAKKFGLVLDDKTLASLKAQKIAQREFHAALEGIQVQIGVALAPVMTFFAEQATQLAITFNENVVPAIKMASQWIKENLVPAIKEFVNSEVIPRIKEFAAVLMDTIVPAAKELATTIKEKLQGPLERLTELLGGKSTVFKDAAIVIGGVLVAAFVAWAVAAGAAAVATIAATLPIIAIGAAAALLGLALYELWKHWDELEKKYPILKTATEAVKTAFEALATWLTGTFVPNFTEGFNKVLGAAKTAYDNISTATGAVIQSIKDHWGQIEPFVRPIFIAIQTYFDVVKDAIVIGIALVRGDWEGAWNAMKQMASDILDGMLAMFGAFKDQAITAFTGIKDAVMAVDWWDLGASILRWAARGLNDVAGEIWAAAGRIADGIKDKLNPKNWIGSPVGIQNWYPYYFAQGMANLAKEAGTNADLGKIGAIVAQRMGINAGGFMTQTGGAHPQYIGGGQVGLMPAGTDTTSNAPVGYYNPTTGTTWTGSGWVQGDWWKPGDPTAAQVMAGTVKDWRFASDPAARAAGNTGRPPVNVTINGYVGDVSLLVDTMNRQVSFA